MTTDEREEMMEQYVEERVGEVLSDDLVSRLEDMAERVVRHVTEW